MALERGNACQQVGAGLFLDLVRDLATEEDFRVAAARRQFDIQLDFLGQRPHPCTLVRVSRQQCLAALGVFQVFEDDIGFIDKAVLGFQARHLAARAHLQKALILTAENGIDTELDALFHQRQLDHIEVVTDGKTVQGEHAGNLIRCCCWCATCSRWREKIPAPSST